MVDIFEKAGAAVATAAKDVAKGAVWVSHIYGEVEGKLSAFSKSEPQVVAAVTCLVKTGEVFLATTVPAIDDRGLNLPADSAAFASLKAFIDSFEAAAATLKQLIAAAK